MEPPPRIHIHEDGWGLRVPVPVAALAEAESELAKARDAQARAASPSSGLGWTDAHIIRPPSIGYAAIPLRVSAAAAALGPHFPRIRDFVATASHRLLLHHQRPLWLVRDAPGATAPGPPASSSWSIRTDRARHLVRGQHRHAEDLARLRAALVAIDAIIPSAIADYWISASGAAGDRGFMDRYFQVLLRD